jgi:hypothetical protein
MHRLRAVAHKSSTSLCTAGGQAVRLPPRQQPVSAPVLAVTQRAGLTRGCGPEAEKIVSGPGPWMLAAAPMTAASAPAASGLGAAAEGPRLCPCRDPGQLGWYSGGCRRAGPGRNAPAGQNETRPPMYEMGGLARPRHAQPGQLPGLAGAARPAGAKYPCEGPVSRLLTRSPGSPPGWCPFPTVKAFLLPPRTPRKSLTSIISGFSAIHMVSTERMRLSAPYDGYPPANSQVVHKSRRVTPRTPIPAVAACNRLILLLRRSG